MNAPLKLGPTLRLLARLEETERWSRARLERAQSRRLAELLKHAYETVPFHRERLARAGFAPDRPVGTSGWQAIPLLTRRDLQDQGDALIASHVPEQFGRQETYRSSGSTGEPVQVVRTQLEQVYWRALTLRDHRWHGRDLEQTLCAIRVLPHHGNVAGGEIVRRGWGAASSVLGATGKLAMIPIATDVRQQARWLVGHDPAYLLTYPSNLLALTEEFEARGLVLPRLRELRTVGETLTPQVAERLRAFWNVPVVDLYSSEETGLLALQCPSGSGLYHVPAESVKLEVLDDHGRACAPGQVGRVVVTSLHNFAMPLVRYEIGDFAEAGPPCACGRGLPTLARIAGRRRNMLVLPDGGRQWPVVGLNAYRGIAPIRRAQMVQHDANRIEMRIVAQRPVTADEERRLTELIHHCIGDPFQLQFTYFDALPAGANGKFEDFISLVGPH
jgi:phenylacetate-CoA ligase